VKMAVQVVGPLMLIVLAQPAPLQPEKVKPA
jgi:hypothetical protein